MRKLLCAVLVLALLAVPVFALSVSAESAVDEDIIISDLMPTDDSYFEATDCEAKINSDGSLTVTITGPDPALKITLAEGATLYTGRDVDLSDTANNPAYVALDFGTAGDIVISHMILHYTRKDKAAANSFADLYLQSMYSDDYKAYRKQVDGASYDSSNPFVNGSSHYVVWDWGTYVAESPAKLFDDKMHHFVDIDLKFGDVNTQKSTIGSQITFYTMAVVSDPDVELGTVTPDPITNTPDDESSEASDDESGETSDDESSEASEDESSEDSEDESSEASSAASSEASSAASSDTSSAASSAATSSTATSSDASASTSSSVSSDSTSDDGGSDSTGLIIGIIVAVVVVIGVVVGVVVAKKKK